MKGIAVILTTCMLFLNAGHLLETLQFPAENAAMEWCADCSSDCCDTDETQEDQKNSCHGDQPCMPGCACSCDFQLTALVYSFMELDGVEVQSYHFGNYLNTYSFEYSSDFLQPPRKV